MRLRSSRQPLAVPPGLGVNADSANADNSSSWMPGSADGFSYVLLQDGIGGGPAPPTQLKLRAGAAFDISVQLYDIVGLPVTAGTYGQGDPVSSSTISAA